MSRSKKKSLLSLISCVLLLTFFVKASNVESHSGGGCRAAELAASSMPYGWGKWDCPPVEAGKGCDCSGMASRDFGLSQHRNTSWFNANSSSSTPANCNFMIEFEGQTHMMQKNTYNASLDLMHYYSCGSPCHSGAQYVSVLEEGGYFFKTY